VFVSHDVDSAILIASEIMLMANRGGVIAKKLRNSLPRPLSLVV
jgi:ABC-type nitrate/sulfonate/bicarbonate transport system ATPase subunit